ncbi:MAG: hypothetical protein L3J08_03480 [Flavobacteriaceae bacterium]|nr:hypothetical protein [Flavobacteriaceae bacterium]
MIFSLALMQGVAITSSKQDVSLQQVALGAGYMSGDSEGGAAGAWGAVALGAGGAFGQLATGGALFGWSPVGWALFGAAVVAGA